MCCPTVLHCARCGPRLGLVGCKEIGPKVTESLEMALQGPHGLVVYTSFIILTVRLSKRISLAPSRYLIVPTLACASFLGSGASP